MDRPNSHEEDCDESERHRYLAILRRITLALGESYSVTDYDPEDYERRIIQAIHQMRG